MDFASPFVYQHARHQASDEEVSDTELNQGFADVQLDREAAPGAGLEALPVFAAAAAAAPAPPPPPARRKKKYRREVDTNIISVNLGSLAEGVEIATGDANFCENCGAAISCVSTLKKPSGKTVFEPANATDAPGADGVSGAELKAEVIAAGVEGEGGEGDVIWECEFCQTRAELTLDEEELPKQGITSVDYLLAPPPVELQRQLSGGSAMVVFVVDISGSMCVSSEVQGRHVLKGDRLADMQGLATRMDGDQFMPGQRRDVTYVSRLQAVQAAVSSHIEELTRGSPDTPVALVTFNSDVTIIGDGTKAPRVLAGDRLNSWETLVAAGEGVSEVGRIGDTHAALTAKLFALEETGPTALGPAVVVATAMAGNSPGSKVILCTDGVANVGLGSLDEVNTDEDQEAADSFYSRVSQHAVEGGVTIDVIGIEGDGCDLENLGAMSDATSGNVLKVNPLELTQNFSSIMASPVVATHASATLLLHRGLLFRAEEGVEGSKLQRLVGNVTADSEVTFEYKMRSLDELQEMGLGDLTTLPFQLQLTYKRLDGGQYMRVISQSKPITRDRSTAEGAMDANVVQRHVAKQCASMAQVGDYTHSRVNAFAWGKLMKRNIRNEQDRDTFGGFVADIDGIDQVLRREQQQDRLMSMASDDDEDFDAFAEEEEDAGAAGGAGGGKGGGGIFASIFGRSAASVPTAPGAKSKKGKREMVRQARKMRRSKMDDLSSALYSAKSSKH